MLVEIITTESLDSQGIDGLMAAMLGRDCPETGEYNHTDLSAGFLMGLQLREEGWNFVDSNYEEVDYFREPRFTATLARLA